MPTALVIDQQPESQLELSELVQECGFNVRTASGADEARKALHQQIPEVALHNFRTENTAGQDDGLLSRKDLADLVVLYLVTNDRSFDIARHGMQIGASDCFHWPDDIERLKESLTDLHEAMVKAGMAGEDIDRSGHGMLRAESVAMSRIYRMIRKVAPTEATILLTGESGSGKELIARTIHELSERNEGPYVAMNCGAISKDLIESELFGHRKGSFTGANASHRGFFERAKGGTLLLDEVTEMSPDLQVKLLRVLETRRIRRVGGEKPIEVDVRIIASTNRDPENAVKENVLREDLYYRLAQFPIRVPPLRERGDDVELLARHFLAEINEREGTMKEFSDEALDLFRLHDWPGNVRELKNAVSRAHILAGDTIQPNDLPGNIPAGGSLSGDFLRFPVGYDLKELERRMILATLEAYENDKPKTAEALGISLKTLYNRLKSYKGD